MKAVFHLACKDLRVLSRDRFALFWIFAFPLMYALFFGALFGGSGDTGSRSRVKIAIVDEDRSPDSARLVQALAEHDSLVVARVVGREKGASQGGGTAESSQNLGAQAEALRLDTLDEARRAVRKGDDLAYVRIPEGFGVSPFALFGGSSEDSPRLEVGIDPSRSAEAGFLQGILLTVVFQGLGETFQDKERMAGAIEKVRAEVDRSQDIPSGQKLVLKNFFGALDRFAKDIDAKSTSKGEEDALSFGNLIDSVDITREQGQEPRSAFEVTFPSAMMWGLMSVALGFAITLVRERTQGTFLRLCVAPLGRAQILCGKALSCFLACLFVLAFLLLFGSALLGLRVESPLLLLMAMASTAFCFTGLMMTVSVLGRTEQAVAGASWGLMMPFAMIGGGMIPLIAMPPWLARLSNFSFFKWGILSMEGAIWRGFGLLDMLLPCAILIAIGLLFFAIGLSVFRRMQA